MDPCHFNDWLHDFSKQLEHICPPGRYTVPNAETLRTLATFLVAWAVFEDMKLPGGNMRQRFEDIANNVNGDEMPELVAVFSFWKQRYTTDGKTNSLFEGLHWQKSSQDAKTITTDVLEGRDDSQEGKIQALLWITYRLRNNLFHGPKMRIDINQQVDNLVHARSLLQALLTQS